MPRPPDRHLGKARLVRIPDEVWVPFKRKVLDEDRTIVEVLTRLIRAWTRGDIDV